MKLIFALSIAIALPSSAADHPAPPAKTDLPDGSLYALQADWKSQTGDTIHWQQSKGTPRIVALGYTTCKGICPRIIADMQRIEKQLGKEAKEATVFTFLSLDPETDKVPELKVLAANHKLDPANWQVLTGTEDGVLELAVALGIQYSRLPNGIDYSHSYLIATLAPDGTVVHKWTIPSEGPEPSVAALHKALANREEKPQPQPAKNAE